MHPPVLPQLGAIVLLLQHSERVPYVLLDRLALVEEHGLFLVQPCQAGSALLAALQMQGSLAQLVITA